MFLPQTLQAQIQGMIDKLDTVIGLLEKQVPTAKKTRRVLWHQLPFTPDTYIKLLAVVISGDMAGQYYLTFGNDRQPATYLAVNTPLYLPFGDEVALSIMKGIPIGISGPAGSVPVASILVISGVEEASNA